MPLSITTCLNFLSRSIPALCLMFLFPSGLAMASDRTSDDYLTGYIASILERDLHWGKDSYTLNIVNGIVTVPWGEGPKTALKRTWPTKLVSDVHGVKRVVNNMIVEGTEEKTN